MESKDDEYFCPNCNAILNDQIGFDPSLGVWKCTQCGQELYDDDIATTMESFNGVVWRCDSCGAILNSQSGFRDTCIVWVCTECGYPNSISEDTIFTSEDDYQNHSASSHKEPAILKLTGAVADFFDILADEMEKSAEVSSSATSSNKTNKRIDKILLILPLFCILFFFLVFAFYEFKMLVSLEYSSQEFIGQNYTDVESILTDCGFSNIYVKNISDLSPSEIASENLVTDIKIAFTDNFDAHSHFPSNFPVVVIYHTLKPITVSFSSKDVKGKNYSDVMGSLKNSGFINISVEPQYDIITGWLVPDGEVASVSINGNKKFSSGDFFRPDDKIVITYHARKES